MAATALSDFDRLANGLASGNVMTGVNTGSGNLGKDALGTPPTRVTQIQFGSFLSGVDADGTDMAGVYGTLHINQDGSYSYTRLPGTIGDRADRRNRRLLLRPHRQERREQHRDPHHLRAAGHDRASGRATACIADSAFDDYIDGSGYSVRPVRGPRGDRWRRRTGCHQRYGTAIDEPLAWAARGRRLPARRRIRRGHPGRRRGRRPDPERLQRLRLRRATPRPRPASTSTWRPSSSSGGDAAGDILSRHRGPHRQRVQRHIARQHHRTTNWTAARATTRWPAATQKIRCLGAPATTCSTAETTGTT